MQSQQLFKWPGKVLLAGGYGVLQKGNSGMVVAVGSYFYARYWKLEKEIEKHRTVVTVESPQISGKWTYEYDWQQAALRQLEVTGSNNFVRCALQHSLDYFCNNETMKGRIYKIVLLFDKDFVSCGDVSVEHHHQKFINFDPSKLKKTGLGSSACVTVAVVSMICLIHSRHDKQLIDCISQIANLAAQGKIGSNFDISSAVHGTHLYTNALPELAHSYLNSAGKDRKIFEAKSQVQPLGNSDKFLLYMVDLQHGSNTRQMVGSFTKRLEGLGEELQKAFFSESKEIVMALAKAYSIVDVQAMRVINQRHRSLQRKYSALTQVQIQPASLTDLLDQFWELPQTAYVICPGSGGYDAICWLTTSQVNMSSLPQSKWEYRIRQLPTSNEGMQGANHQQQQQFNSYLSTKADCK